MVSIRVLRYRDTCTFFLAKMFSDRPSSSVNGSRMAPATIGVAFFGKNIFRMGSLPLKSLEYNSCFVIFICLCP